MLKPVIRLFGAINSNSRPLEIGFGVAAGILMGLVPGGNLAWFALLFLFLLWKINYPSMLVSLVLVKLAAPLADIFLHAIGRTILTFPAFAGFFTQLYNMPIVPYTNFNSTTLMGALVVGLILLVPFALLFSRLVTMYRKTLLPKIRDSRIAGVVRRIPLIRGLIKAASGAGTIAKRS